MHDDDEPVGRVLSRRHAIAILGLAGAGLTASGLGIANAATSTASATATASSSAGTVDCVAKPEMTEGPYFVDEQLNRIDIRSDPSDGSVQAGIKLRLDLYVLQVNNSCLPLKDATVDIWHCNASGGYSDIAAEGTTGQKYLRGYQVTNKKGHVRFTTILPGWYSGRTVHIHVKVRTTGTDGNAYEFTSQLYFNEDFKTAYLAKAPYNSEGTPDTTNATDMHYANGGDQMLLSPTKSGKDYHTQFTIGLDLTDTAVGASDAFSAGGGGTPPTGSPPSATPTASATA